MRLITLTLAAGAMLAASAAFAQSRGLTAYAPTGDPIDNMTCYAQGLAAQYAGDRRADGDIPLKWGLTNDEITYLRGCGGPLPGTPIAVPVTPPPPPPPSAYDYNQSGNYYFDQYAGNAQSAYAPVKPPPHPRRVVVVTNGPVPDTPENRALYPPLSFAGRATYPDGN
jgi:hypothetical protein